MNGDFREGDVVAIIGKDADSNSVTVTGPIIRIEDDRAYISVFGEIYECKLSDLLLAH
jgi:hypothetical protein